jgi:predicted RecB family nuclease
VGSALHISDLPAPPDGFRKTLHSCEFSRHSKPMEGSGGKLKLSASDLTGHLACRHLTNLDLAVATGRLEKPAGWDPFLELLRLRGAVHEQAYIKHLQDAGFDVAAIEGTGIDVRHVTPTIDAMRGGRQIIVQGALSDDQWGGRPDVLRRVETPSDLGDWSYEPTDTKLARETKGGAILQLCLYSDLVARVQGRAPEFMYVVSPGTEFEPQVYRTSDYAAYYRLIKASLEASLLDRGQEETYPDPKIHCEICRWRIQCDARRRADDHLCLVAGISNLNIKELNRHDVNSVAALAAVPLPLPWRPARGSVHTYERIREQARVQVEGRERREPVYEVLAPEPGFGLARLPAPSPGDIFLDFEGDPFVGDGGLEYLLGYVTAGEDGTLHYTGEWALTRDDEKRIFEAFVDFVIDRWQRHPDLHIYHYAPYEPSALKRLMGRYASREEEIDRMLRGLRFVDCYAVVRHAIRASVESYSIKQLEVFYGFERTTDLPVANRALATVQACLELDQRDGITEDDRAVIAAYNRDDCESTCSLRNWLEEIRARRIEAGETIERPPPGKADPSAAISARQERINALVGRLTVGVPADLHDRDADQHARWILAYTLDWHRREEKSVWWEYFRLAALAEEELYEERCAIGGLAFVGPVGGTAKAPTHRYNFPIQEVELRGGEKLRKIGGEHFGTVEAIALEDRMIDIKKRKDTAQEHPAGVFAHQRVDSEVLAESLLRIGEHAANHGLTGGDCYPAARDLLLRRPPRLGGAPLRNPHESALDAALRVAPLLNGGVLPIQGPPGAGKTHTGARMICELVRQGARIGITANSHKVIRNLLNEVIKAADERGTAARCIQKISEAEEGQDRIHFTTDNEDVFAALGGAYNVAGGTAWLWAREEAFKSVDVIFVDEAAQMSLANVLAISQAGASLVLLGDPQQLNQPTQGSHPDGTGVSALDHILGERQTIGPENGIFLEQTWRLHPAICAFTSEMFYEGRLVSRPGLENQRVLSAGPIVGSGLRYLPVTHEGNQSSCAEEADAVHTLVRCLTDSNATWIDKNGVERQIRPDDILIISPYNAQVFELQDRLPGMRIGTVDKFQGQEAPVVIYSMATSTPADAPHGMEFLYSLNRLNVATSRARAISILVGEPALFEPECRTPQQMRLANAFCRYREMAEIIGL